MKARATLTAVGEGATLALVGVTGEAGAVNCLSEGRPSLPYLSRLFA
jgi:hypothetical protein